MLALVDADNRSEKSQPECSYKPPSDAGAGEAGEDHVEADVGESVFHNGQGAEVT